MQTFSSGEEKLLRPGETLSVPALFNAYPFAVRRKLRVTGGVVLPEGYLRNERSYAELYQRIEDCLEPTGASNNPHALVFKGDGEAFERCAWWRIPASQLLPGQMATFRAQINSDNLSFVEDGSAAVQFQIYLKKAGRHPEDIFDSPDQVITLQIPTGTYVAKDIWLDRVIPEETACILVQVCAARFQGAFQLEAPELLQAGRRSPIPPFMPFRKGAENWIGKNLSRKEWPHFELRMDGKVVLSRQVFDRASAASDFELALPVIPAGSHLLALQLIE